MLDDSDLDLPSEQTPAPPPRPRNRFPVVAGLLGSILLLTLIGLAVYALVILPQRRASEEAGQAVQATSTQLALVLQATSTSTPTRTATATRTPLAPTATNTPVTPLFTSNAVATETMNALLTQAAAAQQGQGTQTAAAPTATPDSLPQSGFQDGLGGPGMLIASAALLFIIIITARRLRNANG